jgi:thiosulfate/3-mercaptopyruvate sulfurtransferase
MPSLVSPTWLAARLAEGDLAILDASWYLPDSGRDAEFEYRAMHVPGAVRFDLDIASDPATELPHMLPSPEHFAALMERLGVRREDRVICYDGSGVNLSAARAWWMFRVFRHPAVAVLDGGFPAWASETRPVQRGTVQRPRSGYRAGGRDGSLVCDRAQVDRLVADGSAQIVDCRVPERFRGEVPEPRPGLRRGHVPSSVNLPYPSFTDPETGRFHPPAVLRGVIEDAGVDPARPIVALCGSGTSACILALAIEVVREAGIGPVGPPVVIYDGSWSEYGRIESGR